MKNIFIASNIFLLGVLVFIYLHELDLHGFDWIALIFPVALSVPIVAAIMYVLGFYDNKFSLWFFSVSYFVAAVILFLVFIDLLDSTYSEDWEIFLALATSISLSFNLLFMFTKLRENIKRGKEEIAIDEERFYRQIAEEVENDSFDKVLWTKATALSDGSQDNTKSVYIRLRIKQLKEQASNNIIQSSPVAQSTKKSDSTDWLLSANILKRTLAVSLYSVPGFITLVAFFYIASLSIYLEFFVAFIISVAIWFFSKSKIIWRIILILGSLGLSFLSALPLYFLSVFTLFGVVVFSKAQSFLLSNNRLLRSLSIVSHLYISSITIFLPVTVVSRYYEQDERLFAYIAPFVVIFIIYLFLRQNYEQTQGRWLTSSVSWLRLFSITLYAMPILIIFLFIMSSLIYGL